MCLVKYSYSQTPIGKQYGLLIFKHLYYIVMFLLKVGLALCFRQSLLIQFNTYLLKTNASQRWKAALLTDSLRVLCVKRWGSELGIAVSGEEAFHQGLEGWVWFDRQRQETHVAVGRTALGLDAQDVGWSRTMGVVQKGVCREVGKIKSKKR